MNELIKVTQNENGEQLVSGRELHEFLEVKTPYKKWFDRMCEYGFVENVDFVTVVKGVRGQNGQLMPQKESDHMLRLAMAKEICYKLRRNHKIGETLKQLGENIEQIHTVTRFEVSFGDMLVEALKELEINVISQYIVDNYKIDFYIPKHNIAVEYDEQQHFVVTNQKKDLERQKYIEDKLGCKFIRCDYRDSDIKNVMKVVKEMI